MAGDGLFGELPEQARPQTDTASSAKPRLREPKRDQVELRPYDVDSLIGDDHLARVVWDCVGLCDMSELEDQIKARGSQPGHPTVAPRLMLALWVYATSQGIGSARLLARLCETDNAYRWLCGGVSVNYHTLSTFRNACADLLRRLIIGQLASLADIGVIDLDTLAQDGVKIRASAGTASFRRSATLEQKLETAQAVVEELERETDPEASNKRVQAAKERAARERVERIQKAQAALAEIEQKRKELQDKGGNGKKPKEPRASTTDADARIMKMADAGFRPAYNVQVASVAGEQIVVAVDVTNSGSDGGLMRPMLEQVRAQIGRFPKRHIVDGGFTSLDDIEWAHDQGTAVFCPPKKPKKGTDPYKVRPGDGPGTAAWRGRMGSEEGKAQYAIRVICECIHARWRNWNLRQVTVRGLEKVGAVMLLHVFTNNLLQGYRLVLESFLPVAKAA